LHISLNNVKFMMGEVKNACRILVGKPRGKNLLRKLMSRRENIIKTDLKKKNMKVLT